MDKKEKKSIYNKRYLEKQKVKQEQKPEKRQEQAVIDITVNLIGSLAILCHQILIARVICRVNRVYFRYDFQQITGITNIGSGINALVLTLAIIQIMESGYKGRFIMTDNHFAAGFLLDSFKFRGEFF